MRCFKLYWAGAHGIPSNHITIWYLQIQPTQSNHAVLVQGNIDYTGTETQQIFSSMPAKAKSFAELFTPTLNGIVVK